ncbi:MAG: ribonuclease E [Gemmataceae bacterium]
MRKEMLINAAQPEECRIAIVEDGVLEELYIERASQESYVGNIYKGRIVNIEPSIQAAFVDFGVGRNGFLHVSDVDPSYFSRKGAHTWLNTTNGAASAPRHATKERVDGARTGATAEESTVAHGDNEPHEPFAAGVPGYETTLPDDADWERPTPLTEAEAADVQALSRAEFEPAEVPTRARRRRAGVRGRLKPPIQDIFRRGQEVLVQVIKEGIGTKGPTLSTYISIPGRYLVLMPGLNRIGVSRKITDEETRRRLRQLLGELEPPKGLGFIIRTAGLDRSKKDLQRDLAYLTRLWKVVLRRIRKLKAPALIYQESDMITRTIRDVFTPDIDVIMVDEPHACEQAREFLEVVMPRYASRVQLYSDPAPLFHRYRLEEEIARIQSRHVPLPGGGSIVIDQTEALVAIDVNSGNYRADDNAEETAFRINLAAAREIARQLRLRDLGGVIVNDFIDMREEKHRRDVERALKEAVKRDRARTKIARMSAFGIIEMTRQRIRPSLKRSIYEDCPCCHGTGQVKTTESMSIEVMRLLQLAAHKKVYVRIHVHVCESVAQYLLNRKRRELAALEQSAGLQITVFSVPHAPPETLDILCYDASGAETRWPLGTRDG